MSEQTIKTKAIVVRVSKSGESDSMLTLLSPDMGRLTVLAKGARSLRHKSRGSAQPLCYSSFVLKKLREDFYTLVSAEVIEPFSPLAENVEALSYGIYFAALCTMCTQGSDCAAEISLLLNSLYVLSRKPENAPVIKAAYEIKLCALCGIMPDFTPDCPCGSGGAFFSVSNGEVRCALHREDGVPISPAALRLACYISESSLKDALYATASSDAAFSLWRVTEEFLSYLLGKLPDSLSYLHSIIMPRR